VHHIRGFSLGSTECCMREYTICSCRIGIIIHASCIRPLGDARSLTMRTFLSAGTKEWRCMSVVYQCRTVLAIYIILSHTYFFIRNRFSVLLGSTIIILPVSVYLESVLGTLQLGLCSGTAKQVFMVEKKHSALCCSLHTFYIVHIMKKFYFWWYLVEHAQCVILTSLPATLL
jgi:hypothetical protein